MFFIFIHYPLSSLYFSIIHWQLCECSVTNEPKLIISSALGFTSYHTWQYRFYLHGGKHLSVFGRLPSRSSLLYVCLWSGRPWIDRTRISNCPLEGLNRDFESLVMHYVFHIHGLCWCTFITHSDIFLKLLPSARCLMVSANLSSADTILLKFVFFGVMSARISSRSHLYTSGGIRSMSRNSSTSPSWKTHGHMNIHSFTISDRPFLERSTFSKQGRGAVYFLAN